MLDLPSLSSAAVWHTRRSMRRAPIHIAGANTRLKLTHRVGGLIQPIEKWAISYLFFSAEN